MIRYFALGCAFGIVLIKSEVVSWFRIQEMFRFQSFHMYGVIISAVAVAGLSIALLRLAGVPTLAGEAISIPPKTLRQGLSLLDWRHVVRCGLGADGRVPRPALRAHRRRPECLCRRGAQRPGRHLGVRLSASAPSALLIYGYCKGESHDTARTRAPRERKPTRSPISIGAGRLTRRRGPSRPRAASARGFTHEEEYARAFAQGLFESR